MIGNQPYNILVLYSKDNATEYLKKIFYNLPTFLDVLNPCINKFNLDSSKSKFYFFKYKAQDLEMKIIKTDEDLKNAFVTRKDKYFAQLELEYNEKIVPNAPEQENFDAERAYQKKFLDEMQKKFDAFLNANAERQNDRPVNLGLQEKVLLAFLANLATKLDLMCAHLNGDINGLIPTVDKERKIKEMVGNYEHQYREAGFSGSFDLRRYYISATAKINAILDMYGERHERNVGNEENEENESGESENDGE